VLKRSLWTLTLLSMIAATATPARAQTQSPPPAAVTGAGERSTPVTAGTATVAGGDHVPSLGEIVTGTFANFKRLPSVSNIEWLAVGGVAAAAAHRADANVTRVLAGSDDLHEPFEAGAILGGTPFELSAAFATYGLGRTFGKARIARVGADLVQAQVMAEALTLGLKEAARRARPSGSGFSFPSGHTTVTFASATVLQRHFGWRIGLPAYAVASYVATSRVQQRRHYLSDVAFGAALGTIAGRTVNVSPRHALAIGPMAAPGGGGVSFNWIRR
jgi:membrane-associated phospholipid phosphatase